ncbi:MAG: hypothetical protein H7246_14435 [Phycisphaerae bacterium]|nr:hypothetical protein [Saprospiraceae bacterium]
MKNLSLLFSLLIVFNYTEAIAQFEQSFELQRTSSASLKNEDVKIFYDRFNAFIDALQDSTYKAKYLDPQKMISDFVIFTEEGLIMKDLKFHSAESCKKNILLGKAELGNDKVHPWL